MPIEGAGILNQRMNDTTDTLVQLEAGGDAANLNDYILIDDELMQVTEVINPLNFTVLRAVNGTTIAKHNVNTLVRIGTLPPAPSDRPVQDLTTLPVVKDYLEIASTNTGDDDLLQGLITAVSNYWLLRTSRDSLNQISDYVETYDGTGGMRLALRNYPVVTVTEVLASGSAIAASTDGVAAGYVIDQNKKGLVLVGTTYGTVPSFGGLWSSCVCTSDFERIATQNMDDFVRDLATIRYNTVAGSAWSGSGFPRGVQNIRVTYSAGYENTPMDVTAAVTKQVAIQYKRRGWADQKSIILPQGGGTALYRDWEIPPDIEHVIQLYSRTVNTFV